MTPTFTKDEEQVLKTVSDMPTVTMIFPFEPKMSLKHELDYALKVAVGKVERELTANYPADAALPVIQKLHQLIRTLNFNTHKKSIALFVSPALEKVFYLDVPVEEKIIVDEGFEIRDLVYNKKENIQYLVMLLSGESSKTFLGNCTKFLLIKTNVPNNVHAFVRDMPEKVGKYSDPSHHKEVVLDGFLHHMDEGLSLILNAYPLPVFLMGTEKVLGHFSQLTRHRKNIVGHIHGNFDEATEAEIRSVLQPHIADWKRVKQQNLVGKIQTAEDEMKLVCGMEDVWANSMRKNGRLLIIEKDYMYPIRHDSKEGMIIKAAVNPDRPFYIRDAVDIVIEKILESGGDVEFVDKDVLKRYDHIALIQYYSTGRRENIHFM